MTRAVLMHSSRLGTAPGSCKACGRHDHPRSSTPMTQKRSSMIVVANVYHRKKWKRTELWCLDCYEGAGEPWGTPIRKDRKGRLVHA